MTKTSDLENSRNHLVRNTFTVFLPILLIFHTTLDIISEGAVHQKNAQINDVKVDHEVLKQTRNRPEERQG